MRIISLLLVPALVALSSCGTTHERPAPRPRAQAEAQTPEGLRRTLASASHLHQPLGAPQPGDWLTTSEEPGQTFDEYLQNNPVRATEGRRRIYVQPLGDFDPAQRRVVTLTADFMSRFFGLPVEVREDLPLSLVPSSARRVHPEWGTEQLQAGYISMNILKPSLPEDAAALVAFTAADLYPGPELNFVFGQASLVDRVGVWSLHRLGDPAANELSFKLVLLRTMKIAAHETGHMFSIRHCTKYECVMCGSNHINETDRRPVELCPECMAKICWATDTDPLRRYAALAAFFAQHGYPAEQRFFETSIEALKSGQQAAGSRQLKQ